MIITHTGVSLRRFTFDEGWQETLTCRIPRSLTVRLHGSLRPVVRSDFRIAVAMVSVQVNIFLKSASCLLATAVCVPPVVGAKGADRHIVVQATSITEGNIWEPRIRQIRGDHLVFTSDADVLGPGTAHLGHREVYLLNTQTQTSKRITSTTGGESYSASRLTDDMRSVRPPIIAFISTGDLDPSVGNTDGNPELFIWIQDSDTIRQLTNTLPPVVNAEPSPSDSARCIVFQSSGDLDNNDGSQESLPPTGRSNSDGSLEIFYVDFSDRDFQAFQFTQVSSGPAGSTSRSPSVGGFFFPNQCESITYESDHDQLGNGTSGVNVYRFKRRIPETTQISLPTHPGTSSVQPKVSGTGVVAGAPSVVFISDADLFGFGIGGFQIYKYRILHPRLRQHTAIEGAFILNPVLSDGGSRIALESVSELVNPDRRVRLGGPGPFNTDASWEIFRLDGKRRVRQLTRTQGCENHFPTITGNGKGVAFLSTCDLIPGHNPNGLGQVFVYTELKRHDPRQSAAGCVKEQGCCNPANGCYQPILGRAVPLPRKKK